MLSVLSTFLFFFFLFLEGGEVREEKAAPRRGLARVLGLRGVKLISTNCV